MAGDPLADMQNVIGFQGLVGDNPYLTYQGKIPFSTPDRTSGNFYVGQNGNLPPTDVYGNPNQSFVDYNTNAQADYQKRMAAYNAQTPGRTINSNPINGGGMQQDLVARYYRDHPETNPDPNAAQPANSDMRQYLTEQSLYSQGNPATLNQGGFGAGNNVASNTQSMQDRGNALMLDQLNRQGGMGAPANARGPAPPDLSQAYLDALAKPTIRQYGANPPQPGQSPTGSVAQPSVFQSFLATNPNASNPIFNPLRKATT